MAQMVKNLPAMWETGVWCLGWEDPLEKGMTIYSILVWRIPWTEKPGRLQSTESQRVGHDKVNFTHAWDQAWPPTPGSGQWVGGAGVPPGINSKNLHVGLHVWSLLSRAVSSGSQEKMPEESQLWWTCVCESCSVMSSSLQPHRL